MKWLNILKYIMLVASVAVVLPIFFVLGDVQAEGSMASTMIVCAYIFFAIAIALVIILPLVNMIGNPKGAQRSMLGLALVVVVGVVSYLLASGAPVPNSGGGFFEDETVNKLSDVGIYMSYAALAIAILVAFYGEVRNALK